MSRLPVINREALAPDDQAVWDRIAAVRTGVRGPFGVLMHVPALADRVAALEDYFRFNAAIPPVDRELVIMATAREMNARYPWARHEARGREVGTRIEAIEAVRVNGTLEQLTTRERLLVEIVRTLLRTHRPAGGIVYAGASRTGSTTTNRDRRAHRPLQPDRIGRERVRCRAAG